MKSAGTTKLPDWRSVTRFFLPPFLPSTRPPRSRTTTGPEAVQRCCLRAGSSRLVRAQLTAHRVSGRWAGTPAASGPRCGAVTSYRLAPGGGRRTGVLESSDPKANRRIHGPLINPGFLFSRNTVCSSHEVSWAHFAFKDGEVFFLWTGTWCWYFFHPPPAWVAGFH